jgi:hypothetical protein
MFLRHLRTCKELLLCSGVLPSYVYRIALLLHKVQNEAAWVPRRISAGQLSL